MQQKCNESPAKILKNCVLAILASGAIFSMYFDRGLQKIIYAGGRRRWRTKSTKVYFWTCEV